MLVVDSRIQIPWSEVRLTFARSSGPGGQNVNKVNSKVTLHWNVAASDQLPADVRDRFLSRYHGRVNVDGEVVIQSQRYRDQLRNRQDCAEKLRQLILSVRYPPKKRKKTRPSRASRERRLRNKRHKSDKKRLRKGPRMNE